MQPDSLPVPPDAWVIDAQGISMITGNTGSLAETTLPLKLAVKVSMHEQGGRTTDKTVEIPIASHDAFIGIRPDFQGGSVAENVRAGFEAIAVTSNGKRIALSGLTYSWVREDTNYQWFQTNGQWKYQSTTRDHLIVAGGGGLPVFYKQSPTFLLVNGRTSPKPLRMTVGDTNRIRIVSIHADEILGFRFGTEEQVARWNPLARDGADLPNALRRPQPAVMSMGPGETADFTYVPTRPGSMMLEVWTGAGQRVAMPVEIQARTAVPKR